MKRSTLSLIVFLGLVALALAGNGMAIIPALFAWVAYDNRRCEEVR